jgi:phage tail-like protein
MPPPGRRDPLHRHNYQVEIGGMVFASFQEVEGLEWGMDVMEYAEGGNTGHTQKFRGQGRAGNIILRRGMAVGRGDFWDWVSASQDDTDPASGPRQNGSIILCDDAGREVKRWNFTNAFPLRIKGPVLNSGAEREIAIEEIVVAVDSIQIQEEEASESESEVSEGGNGEASESQSEGGNGEASESQSEGEVSQS